MIKFASVHINDKVYVWDDAFGRREGHAEEAIVIGLQSDRKMIRVRVVSSGAEPWLDCSDLSTTEQGARPVTQAWVDRLLDKAIKDNVSYVLEATPQTVAFDMVMCIDECQHHAPIEFEPYVRVWQQRKATTR